MEYKNPIQLDKRIHLIDGFDLGMPERTGTYVIDEEALTLVETGPSPSIKYIKKGLETLGFSLDQVKYIIVTHIHLDHAGGVGLFLKECPNASVIVHPKGARHLANPERLIAGAKVVYGDKFTELFDPILPVPEEQLIEKGEGDTLKIGAECTLEFLDTPGHANHHFSIYDPISNGMFAGDTVGIHYKKLFKEGIDLFIPPMSPNQFNPNAMKEAMDRMHNMNLDRIYYGHFGMTENVDEALRQGSYWIDEFVEIGEQSIAVAEDYHGLSERLLRRVKKHLQALHIPDDHDVYTMIKIDMEVSAMGIIDYFEKLKR